MVEEAALNGGGGNRMANRNGTNGAEVDSNLFALDTLGIERKSRTTSQRPIQFISRQ
jgi:hypothetical protein